MPVFLNDSDFNSVIYDHRRHGDSGGKTTSFGYYEKIDLQAIVDKIREEIGEEAITWDSRGINGCGNNNFVCRDI